MTQYELLTWGYTIDEFAEFILDILPDPYEPGLPWYKAILKQCTDCQGKHNSYPPCETDDCPQQVDDPKQMILKWLESHV